MGFVSHLDFFPYIAMNTLLEETNIVEKWNQLEQSTEQWEDYRIKQIIHSLLKENAALFQARIDQMNNPYNQALSLHFFVESCIQKGDLQAVLDFQYLITPKLDPFWKDFILKEMAVELSLYDKETLLDEEKFQFLEQTIQSICAESFLEFYLPYEKDPVTNNLKDQAIYLSCSQSLTHQCTSNLIKRILILCNYLSSPDVKKAILEHCIRWSIQIQDLNQAVELVGILEQDHLKNTTQENPVLLLYLCDKLIHQEADAVLKKRYLENALNLLKRLSPSEEKNRLLVNFSRVYQIKTQEDVKIIEELLQQIHYTIDRGPGCLKQQFDILLVAIKFWRKLKQIDKVRELANQIIDENLKISLKGFYKLD